MEKVKVSANSSSKFKVIDICQIALMAALVFLTTWFSHIPSVTNMGVNHIGDSMVFIAAILFNRKKAVISSAIGMALFDILTGYAIWAPFTLIIKGTMALVAGLVAYRKGYKGDNILNNIFAFILAGIWMIVAYYFAGVAVAHFALSMDAVKSFITPLNDIVGNIVEVSLGIIVAIPLSKAIKHALKNAKIDLE